MAGNKEQMIKPEQDSKVEKPHLLKSATKQVMFRHTANLALVLPPGEFNGIVPEGLAVYMYAESFINVSP